MADFAGIIAIVSLISFMVNLCGFCGSFSLCTKMSEEEDE